MRREYREHFPCHQLQRKPLVSDPDMHHGTCVTHVPWCMSGSLTGDSGENVPGIPGTCTTRNFTYLARGPWKHFFLRLTKLGSDAGDYIIQMWPRRQRIYKRLAGGPRCFLSRFGIRNNFLSKYVAETRSSQLPFQTSAMGYASHSCCCQRLRRCDVTNEIMEIL